MAGVAQEPSAGPGNVPETGKSLSSWRFFTTIAWLRWRIFANSLRGKGAWGELAVRFLSYPLLALMIFGPSVGAGIAGYAIVHRGRDAWLAAPLWVIFALWHFINISTSTTAPSFDLTTLTRFPIRYADYFLIRLLFGLLDPPTVAGITCLAAMCLGVAIADLTLLPWAACALFLYAACNVLFSRMLYSWLERWLAKRRARELVTGMILIGSLGIQFGAQFMQRMSEHRGAQPSAWVLKTGHALVAANWLLPPGLTAKAIEHMHGGSVGQAAAALAGVLVYTGVFLLILHVRIRAQFLGENLSEAPAAAQARRVRLRPAEAIAGAASTPSRRLLPAGVAACLVKELRYLLRSGPKLYVLIMPVFIIVLMSARSSGLSYLGVSRGMTGILFSYGCAYMELIFVGMLYNSLGSDGWGVQFYFLSPMRFRDVMLAKNLLVGCILVVEMVLMYLVAASMSKAAPLDLTVATISWTVFTFLLNTAIGNVRSITSPKGVDASKMRSQNVSGVNSFISLLVVLVSVGLGALLFWVCRWLHTDYWIAAGVFVILAGVSMAIYLATLQRLDGIAVEHAETLTRELCKG